VYERDQILAALHHTGGNQTRAAKVLGFSRRTLTNKLNQHGMPRPRKRSS
jgi:DNA-binding NtrC family response regulator